MSEEISIQGVDQTKCALRSNVSGTKAPPLFWPTGKGGGEGNHNTQWIFLWKLNMKAKLC